MSNVLVNKDKIDILANAISTKSGEPLTLTLDEMVEAVDGIETGGGITPTGNIDITQAGTTDVTNYATATVPRAEPWVGNANRGFFTENGQRKWHIRPMVEFSEGEQVGWMDTDQFGEYVTVNAVPSNTTITPTESAQTIGGYNYMMQGAVTVNAIPSNYVGSGITQRSSSDLTASGATVTAPSGYYASNASKAVSNGSVTAPASISGSSASVSTGTNTLTLSKTVSVTPNVTTAGYVSSGTAGNSNVSLTASVTTQGAQTLHPSTTDQTITGSKYLTGTQTFKAVTTSNLTADNIKSGVTVKIGDSTDDDCVTSVTGTYSGGGGTSKNAQVVQGTTRTNASTLTAIGAELTVSKTGTYDIYWSGMRSNTSSSYTWATQLYIDGTAYGSEQTTWSNNVQNIHLSNVSLTANQKIRVRGRNTRGTSYYVYAPTLVIVEA